MFNWEPWFSTCTFLSHIGSSNGITELQGALWVVAVWICHCTFFSLIYQRVQVREKKEDYERTVWLDCAVFIALWPVCWSHLESGAEAAKRAGLLRPRSGQMRTGRIQSVHKTASICEWKSHSHLICPINRCEETLTPIHVCKMRST